MPIREALDMAQSFSMDLVAVSLPDAVPVICKIMNFGKERYEKQKKQHKTFNSQKKMKEIKMGIKIEKHDLEIKINHGIQFLHEGHSVRFIIQLRGRDMQRKDEAFKIMAKIIEFLADISKPNEQPTMIGNVLSMIFTVDKKVKTT
ncbi:unnamed protein product [Rotaria magnacalcarata]|nr:unnamed protein product [Rotaria magnacalcarata]